jgi:deoxyadenosine/deoxycytidine kinase
VRTVRDRPAAVSTTTKSRKENMYIAIAGNIGSGKTTLTRLLARHYGWQPRFENVANNPYIDDYYRDIKRWSFNMEVFYLKERFRTLLEINRSKDTIIQDRTIFEGVYVFTATNRAMGNLSDRDFDTYMGLFESMMLVASYPDLMVYLKASVPHLVDNIHKRGRDYEQSMRLDYLSNLNDRYDDFIGHHYPGRVLTIGVDDLDFVHSRDDFSSIVSRIDRELDRLEGAPDLFNTSSRTL